MEWLWIPVVVLVVVFVFVLCCLFFSDYTCCPFEKQRPPSCDVDRSASPSVAIDIDAPHSLLRSQPRSISFDGQFQPSEHRTRPQPPPPPPPRRPTPHLTSLIQYNFGGNVQADNVVRMEHGAPTLDLHQMRVKEAVHVTETFLKQSRGKYRRVRIITGRGLHSVNGVPKIKPAVEELLSGRNYREMAKGGCLEVTM